MSCFRQNTNHQSQDEKHNNFNGMVWALFNKGKIFEKMAQHPVILNTSNIIIGENSAVSSLAANTVLPGNGGMKDQLIKSLRNHIAGQLPHLDYPQLDYPHLDYPQSGWSKFVIILIYFVQLGVCPIGG